MQIASTRKEAMKFGLNRYFTGKPCINGHISERWPRGRCKACFKYSNLSDKQKLRSPEQRASKAVRDKVWRMANPEQVKLSGHLKYLANKQKRLAYSIAWAAAHPEEILRHQKVFRQRHPEKYRLPHTGWHVDHIIALSRGGSNDKRNLQILCAFCNKSKGARDPIEHANKLGLLI